MPRAVAVVQARMGSTRYPGKAMALLGGRPLIEWVVRRVLAAKTISAIVVAAPDSAQNDAMADAAERLGAAIFRGSEDDVLGRMTKAARAQKADEFIRVCADNPFVSPREIDALVDFYRKEKPDYAFNHVPKPGAPHADGLGAEMASFSLVEALDREAVEPRHREHMFLLVTENPGRFKSASPKPFPDAAFPDVKLDVDTPADLERLSRLDCLDDVLVEAGAVVRAARR